MATEFKNSTRLSNLHNEGWWAAVGAADTPPLLKRYEAFDQHLRDNPNEGRHWVEDVALGVTNFSSPMLRGQMEGGLAAGTALSVGAIAPPVVAAAPLAYALGSQFYWYRQGVGSMYIDMVRRGIDPTVASYAAQAFGIPYAALESLQVTRAFPGVRRFFNTRLGQAAEVAVETVQRKINSIVPPTVAGEVARGAGRFAFGASREISEEFGQEILEASAAEASSHISNTLADTQVRHALGERLAESVEGLLQPDTGLALAALVAPAYVGNTARRAAAVRRVRAEIEALSEADRVDLGVSSPQVERLLAEIETATAGTQAESTAPEAQRVLASGLRAVAQATGRTEEELAASLDIQGPQAEAQAEAPAEEGDQAPPTAQPGPQSDEEVLFQAPDLLGEFKGRVGERLGIAPAQVTRRKKDFTSEEAEEFERLQTWDKLPSEFKSTMEPEAALDLLEYETGGRSVAHANQFRKEYKQARDPREGEPLLPHGLVERRLGAIFRANENPTADELAQAIGAPIPKEGIEASQSMAPISYEQVKTKIQSTLDESPGTHLWYNEVGRGLRQVVGEANMAEASGLMAVTSAQTAVRNNVANTLWIMHLARRFLDVNKGRWDVQGFVDFATEPENFRNPSGGNMFISEDGLRRIAQFYEDGVFRGGIKTGTYALDIFERGAGRSFFPFTVNDVHVARGMGFIRQGQGESGAVVEDPKFGSDNEFRYAQYLLSRAASELGISPDQAQAAFWFHVKTKEAPGQRGDESQNFEGGTWDEALAFSQAAVEELNTSLDQTKPILPSFDNPYIGYDSKTWSVNDRIADTLQRHAQGRGQRVVVSTKPGTQEGESRQTGVDVSLEDLQRFHSELAQALTDDTGNHITLLNELGIDHTLSFIEGSWEGREQSLQIHMPFADEGTARAVAALMGDALRQDATVYGRPRLYTDEEVEFLEARGESPIAAVELRRPEGGRFTDEELTAIDQALAEQGMNFSSDPAVESLVLLNFEEGVSHAEFVDRVASTVSQVVPVRGQAFFQSGELLDAQDYAPSLQTSGVRLLARPAQSPDLAARIHNLLYQPVDQALQNYQDIAGFPAIQARPPEETAFGQVAQQITKEADRRRRQSIREFERATRGTSEPVLLEQGGQGGPRGSIAFGPEGRAVIRLFESADETTLVHELGHWFRRLLPESDQATLARWVGAEPGQAWTAAQEERWADALTQHLFQPDQAPGPIRGAVQRFGQWMNRLLQAMRLKEGLTFSRGAQKVADGLLGGARERQSLRAALASSGRPRPAPRPPRPSGGPSLARQESEDPTRSLEIGDETSSRWLQRKIQDRFNRVTQIQESPDLVPDSPNLRRSMDLYIGRASVRLERAEEELVENRQGTAFLQRLTKAGISVGQFGEFLYARHAKERNAHILAEHNREDGSGMSDGEADNVLANYPSGSPIYEFEKEFRRRVTKKALSILKDAKLLTDEQAQTLAAQYSRYVPLKGKAGKKTFPSLGRGFEAAGSGIRQARGREDLADNPFIQALVDHQQAIVRAEKAKVNREFLELAQKNPSSLWKVARQRYVPRYDDEGNLEYVEPVRQGDRTTMSISDAEGKYWTVEIRDEALSNAMLNLGAGRGIPFFMQVHGFMRSTIITLSPEFLLSNPVRDMQAALIHLTADESAKVAAKTFKDTPAALRAVWRQARGKDAGEWAQWIKDFEDDGAKIGWVRVEQTEELIQKLERRAQGGTLGMLGRKVGSEALAKLPETSVARAGKAVFNFMEDANQATEMGVRLAAYRNLVEAGMEREDAARAVRDMTVDFNRQGEWRWLNQMYLFFNASIQGSTRLVKAIATSRKAQAISVGLMASGFFRSWMNRLIDEDDWEDVPPHIKDTHWLVGIPVLEDTPFAALKMPYGYNVFVVTGTVLEEVVNGNLDELEAASRIVGAAVDAFTPMSTGSLAQFAAPTFLEPLVQVWENKTFYGGLVKPEQPKFGAEVPRSQLYFTQVREPTRLATNWLNRITGGSDKVSGAIDISPEDIDHLIDAYGGGTARFFLQSLGAAQSLLVDDELPDMRKVPILRQWVKLPSEQTPRRLAFDLLRKSGNQVFPPDQVDRFAGALRRAVERGAIEQSKAREMERTFNKNQREARQSLIAQE